VGSQKVHKTVDKSHEKPSWGQLGQQCISIPGSQQLLAALLPCDQYIQIVALYTVRSPASENFYSESFSMGNTDRYCVILQNKKRGENRSNEWLVVIFVTHIMHIRREKKWVQINKINKQVNKWINNPSINHSTNQSISQSIQFCNIICQSVVQRWLL
jgi:hypothetical protein